MISDFKGKVVVVTGGTSGIGAAICDAFITQGAKVWCADLDLPQRAGMEARVCDVSHEAQVQAFFEEVIKREHTLDIVVNNAGIQPLGVSISETTPELMMKTMDVNVSGALWGIKQAAKYMTNRGSIVNLASFVGTYGVPGGLAYSVSKAGVAHLTRCAALELAPKGIRVNAVAPGTIRTPAVEDISDNPEIPFVEGRTPLGRLGTPSEVAQVVLFLASSAASYVTGAIIPVDGGITAGWERYELKNIEF